MRDLCISNRISTGVDDFTQIETRLTTIRYAIMQIEKRQRRALPRSWDYHSASRRPRASKIGVGLIGSRCRSRRPLFMRSWPFFPVRVVNTACGYYHHGYCQWHQRAHTSSTGRATLAFDKCSRLHHSRSALWNASPQEDYMCRSWYIRNLLSTRSLYTRSEPGSHHLRCRFRVSLPSYLASTPLIM